MPHIALRYSMVINRQRLTSANARLMAEQVGATDIVTVGATGNLLFRSRKSPARLESELEAACARIYGRATEVVVKAAGTWRALVAANPFPEETARAPARVLVWAMREPLPDAGRSSCVGGRAVPSGSSGWPAASTCSSARGRSTGRNCRPGPG